MAHTETSIRASISEYIQREYFSEDPSAMPESGLLSQGFIDSVSTMVLIDFLEESFGIEFEPHEVDPDNLDSIDVMVAFVQGKLQ